MHKTLTTLFLTSLLFTWSVFSASTVLAEEDIEYRFERLWPRLEQPWYFSGTRGIAVAPSGDVYIANAFNHRVKQFSATGDFIRTLEGEGSGGMTFFVPRGIAAAADGSVYIADATHIQQFSEKGDFIRAWGSYGSEDGQFNSPSALAIASNGDVYVAGHFNHHIQQFNAKGDFIRSWGSEGTDDGQFNRPKGIAIGLDGSVYVADSLNSRIQQFSAEGHFIRKWGEWGIKSGQFAEPTSLTITSDGNVYVADLSNGRIQQFSAEGDFIRTWGSSGIEDGQFLSISAVSISPRGHIYASDDNRIQQFSSTGVFIQSWGSAGGGSGQFSNPKGLTVAVDGSLYVADHANRRIQQFNADGEFIRVWDDVGSFNDLAVAPDGDIYVVDNEEVLQFSADGVFIRSFGSRKPESPWNPQSIAVAPDGNIYVADFENHRIQQFNTKGDAIRTWGGIGSKAGQFKHPQGIAVAPDKSVFVADTENDRIQQFNADGVFIRTWGSQGSGNGEFNDPTGIAIASDGSVYVVDLFKGRIQKFSAEGDFIQVWGGAGSGDGLFSFPRGIAIAPDGSIYVGDTGNNRIQKFVPKSKVNIAPTVPESVTISHPYKAIILAGGGETIGGRTNHIWDGTWRVTQKAYKALSRQAFNVHDEIKFLTAGSTQFDLDLNNKFDDLEKADKESLRRAITEWAKDAKEVVIFLANHGGPGKFQVNSSEILTGKELNSWVTQLDNSIPGTVTVIIEACNSASFFDQLAKPKRNLFASAKADQPAVISNGGLSSFSYFFWSEIGTGAYLQEAFRTARQGMSPIIIDGLAQDAQADTNGDQRFTLEDLEALGDYCLGNCNQTAAAAPVIRPIQPNSRTLNGETSLNFSVKVDHLQELNRVWALVQRPDDISIDPNQALNFEKITLNCDSEAICQGQYEKFDLQGEYRLSFYAMDEQYEVSFPEIMTITQNQGSAVIPTVYDDQLAVVYLRDVLVDGTHLQVALEFQGDKFVVIAMREASEQFSPAAQFDSGILTIPHALAFGKDYQATFKYLGNLEFELLSATPK